MSTWQLEDAVAKEDYTSAARLRDLRKGLLAELPPARQILFHKLAVVTQQGASMEDKLAAINTLGESKDVTMVPALATLLRGNKELAEAATGAMWALFSHSGDPAADVLMQQGIRLMGVGDLAAALQVFERLVVEAPMFSEGHNKRATVLYLMERWPESVEVCKTVLELQPYHFGAAAGVALCHVQLEQYEEALAAFDLALRIHPGMPSIARHAAHIRDVHARSQRERQVEQDQSKDQA